ncbi:Receptor-like protein kinase [Melia azedarach]|uniref:Receptor-like protein kinase n=1 Tax=Melia azedarach TaxID=155640 RepID=A0ACC1X8I2_MELAZ|nr:Receptor-like protein kinase [Melia azedarach]
MASFADLYIFIPFLVLLSTAAEDTSSPYVPTDIILLNCGESSNTTSSDGRSWDGDARSKFFSSTAKSSVSKASYQDHSASQVPYMTARIFPSPFTYAIPASPGPKFLRLYFYPVPYPGVLDNISTAFFSVSVNNYMLLNNFSAYLTASAVNPPAASFIKEFIISVSNNQVLNLTFTPSPSSYAFINGIEIVSMPDNLYTTKSDNKPIPFVNSNIFFYFDKPVALETAYRLNVGGPYVSAKDDTGMFREWQDDSNNIYAAAYGVTPQPSGVTVKYTGDTPAYTAPTVVYTTSRTMGKDPNLNKRYNLTWIFSVDPGFNYLVRLHFCETQLEVTRENQRVFSIFINNQTAEKDADVINWSGGSGIPVFKDYVVSVPIDDNHSSKQDFWLDLHPFLDLDPLPKFADAILNGLEMFKINNSDGNLAGPNPEPKLGSMPPEPQTILRDRRKTKRALLVVIIVVSVLGAVFAISLLCFFIFRSKRRTVKSATIQKTKSSWDPISYTVNSVNTNASPLPSDLCRRFSLAEIKRSTSDFDEHGIVGSGGFGHVYKGCIDCDGSTTVAIKRLNSLSTQGFREFHTEIEMISKVRHLHVVSLLGFCDEEGEMILVYEYMTRGNLRSHLYNSRNPPLPWKRRLEICIGAARGLYYLHAGAKHTIIHRDVKSTNILLDENWAAKISDFGLSRMGPTGLSKTHVSTVVKGSFGYVDPEYYRRQHLTEKSDVYAFGVVLLEVLFARPSVINGVKKEEASLVSWARLCSARGTVDQIVDPHLRGEIAQVCLNKYMEIAESCVRDEGIQRPTMCDVLWGLEFALQLQEIAEKNKNGGDDCIEAKKRKESPLLPRGDVTTTDDDDPFSGSGSGGHVALSRSTMSSGGKSINRYDYVDGLKSEENIFSEIEDPKGR